MIPINPFKSAWNFLCEKVTGKITKKDHLCEAIGRIGMEALKFANPEL